MKLSKRLQMNVSLVPQGAKVADIGCDHGYASMWLVNHGISTRVIAMDVNKGPLERAMTHIRDGKLEDQIECRLSDGTQNLVPGEVDTLMIAGMGGPLMMEIIQRGKDVLEQINTLVLQPQSEIGQVRRFLISQGFVITDEKACVEDGKYYFAIQAQRSQRSDLPDATNILNASLEQAELPSWQYQYGPCLIQKKDAVLLAYLKQEEATYIQISQSLEKQQGQRQRKQELAMQRMENQMCQKAMDVCDTSAGVKTRRKEV